MIASLSSVASISSTAAFSTNSKANVAQRGALQVRPGVQTAEGSVACPMWRSGATERAQWPDNAVVTNGSMFCLPNPTSLARGRPGCHGVD